MEQPQGFRFHLPEPGEVLEVYYGPQLVATLQFPRAFFIGIVGELGENVDVQIFCDGRGEYLGHLEDVMLEVLAERRLRRDMPLSFLAVEAPKGENLN